MGTFARCGCSVVEFYLSKLNERAMRLIRERNEFVMYDYTVADEATAIKNVVSTSRDNFESFLLPLLGPSCGRFVGLMNVLIDNGCVPQISNQHLDRLEYYLYLFRASSTYGDAYAPIKALAASGIILWTYGEGGQILV